MTTLEEQKKLLVPFLQRAQEIERAEPKVAYYCRMYALEQGLEIPKGVRTPEIGGVLEAVMGKLEKDRAVLQLNRDEDQAHCESFALAVFNRADRVDRAGRADKATAVTFYAASYFFEVLRHFGEPPADIQQKQRYAAWRAAEINKAVKEGRPPAPPPSATAAELDEEAAMLDELAKLEMAGSSSASGSLPAAPSGPAGLGAGTSAGAWPSSASAAAPPPPPPPAAVPPSPPSAAASTRLSGLPPALDEDSDWAPPGQPAPGSAPPPPAMPPPPLPFDAPAAGPPAGGQEGQGDDHFRLPSPPKQRPIETQHSHGAWVPPPPRRFQTFQKVLFKPEGAPAPVRGTVAKVEEGPDPERPTYLVALPDRIAAVSDPTQLAPELATGEAVRYHGPSGHSMDATVAELELSHWPPSYLVRLADGNYVDTTDDRLVQLNVPKPRSEGVDLSRMGLGGSSAAAGGTAPSSTGGAYPPAPPAAPAAAAPQPPPPAAAAALHPARSAAAPAAAAPAAVAVPQPVPGYQPGLREITEAAKLTKSATSALQFEDVNTAVRLLSEAIGLLTQPQRK